MYLNLPNHFTTIDTSKISILFHQSETILVEGEASFIYGEIDFKTPGRSFLRLGVSYSVIDRGGIADGLGDGFLYGDFRLFGDTLSVSGLYLRGHLRVPMGSRAIFPYSYGSAEGGIGVEGRMRFPLFFLRIAGSYRMSEKREGELNLANYAIGAVSFRVPVITGFDFVFRGYYVVFKGGDSREIYELSLLGRMMESLRIEAGWLVDSGDERERVFDSQIFISVRFVFPSSTERSDVPPPGKQES